MNRKGGRTEFHWSAPVLHGVSFLFAVKNLIEVFPQLLDKLRRVEQKSPANNISSSIQRIRELIAQTRSVASKVKL